MNFFSLFLFSNFLAGHSTFTSTRNLNYRWQNYSDCGQMDDDPMYMSFHSSLSRNPRRGGPIRPKKSVDQWTYEELRDALQGR